MTFRRIGGYAIFAAIMCALLSACPGPTWNPNVVKDIKTESRALMAAQSPEIYAEIPTSRWPLAIARLKPERVTVNPEGVTIRTKAFFDDGWGYFVPRNPRQPPEPAIHYSALGHGVYWFHFY